MSSRDNGWYFSPDHRQLCKVIETQTLWGETTCRVWLPGSDSVVRVPASSLKPLESAGTCSPDEIAYIAAAARVADALAQDVLLAPIASSVIPLPHQIRALSRAVANNRVRYLLADEVSLGKTVEAGLVMRELKLRGLPWNPMRLDQRVFREQLEYQAQVYPEMTPLLLVRVDNGGAE